MPIHQPFFSRIPPSSRSWFATALRMGCVILCAATLCAQLRLCDRCGVEARDGETECRECGALLPTVRDAEEAVETPDTPPLPDGASAAVAEVLRVVGDDARTARANEQTHPHVAFHYYRHTIGLVRVVPTADLTDEAREGLLAGLARCRQSLSRCQRDCTLCNGTGKRAMPAKQAAATGSKGLASTTAAPTLPDCERCHGKGRVTGPRTMEELRVVIGQGRTEFERQMHALGRVGCGRGFLPAGLEARLTLQERALIRGGLANGCAACMGLGKVDCTSCKGIGSTVCKGRGCVNGLVAGVGDAPPSACAVCHGEGLLACASCQGNGAVSCRACRGSGQADRCKACGGSGIGPCPDCKGKRADCKVCGGANRALCAQCFGEGVKGR
ncbi:MAG: hypothetical protein FWF96_03060 [Kiritimatiellaeota bacterium]|nr:hypothetical protein [Kiritimatiellota bacterium]